MQKGLLLLRINPPPRALALVVSELLIESPFLVSTSTSYHLTADGIGVAQLRVPRESPCQPYQLMAGLQCIRMDRMQARVQPIHNLMIDEMNPRFCFQIKSQIVKHSSKASAKMLSKIRNAIRTCPVGRKSSSKSASHVDLGMGATSTSHLSLLLLQVIPSPVARRTGSGVRSISLSVRLSTYVRVRSCTFLLVK
jgi:hypothetical protein